MKKTKKSTLLLPLVAALSFSFSVGCGSDNTSTPNIAGRAYAAVTNGFSSALGTVGSLQVFTGLNNNNASSGPSAALALGGDPQCLALDISRDRIYVGMVTASGSQLLIYNNASQINSSSTPVGQFALPGTVISASYDAARDILYMGNTVGTVVRILGASGATTGTIATGTALTGITNLNSILDDSTNDRLITASNAGGPIVNLPIFTSASSLLAPSVPATAPGITNALDVKFGDNGRLLVLDSGASTATFGAATTRVFRYDNNASNFSTAPSLQINVPGSNCIAYDGSQDSLYVGQNTGQITVFTAESTLAGVQPSAGTYNLVTNPTAGVTDIAVDPTR